MTRVFVYEYTCAAPPASLEAGGAAALCAEGEAMLRAVLADFRRVPGVEAFTILQEPDEEAAFRAAARQADWTLVIAPEFHDILLTRCRWVLEEGGRLLGPSPEAVELCGDKLRLAEHLHLYTGMECSTWPFPPGVPAIAGAQWIVRKPRFGAGSQDTYVLRKGIDPDPPESSLGEMIEQEYVSGVSASVAYLTGPNGPVPLLAGRQLLSEDGRLKFLGGRIPLTPDLAEFAIGFAYFGVMSVMGLCGYVGVDLVLAEDDRQSCIIEINPRLTTSYIGLRELAETNLAEVMLRLAEGRDAPPITWRPGTVEFTPDGQVRFV